MGECHNPIESPGLSRARKFTGFAVFLLASWTSAQAQLPPCYAGFEMPDACIAERGLDWKAADYQRKIQEAMPRLGASYKVGLRVVNHPVEAGYNAATVADVFTDVVRNKDMRNESFIINVTADFLEKQPEILFEASSLHEICHVMNDDLTGYHRNGENIEAAEEHCVLQKIGEARYKEYLHAYAAYQHWDTGTYEKALQRIKAVAIVPAPSELDEADRLAAAYFAAHADGKQHLLIYNGDLHDVTLESTTDRVRPDSNKLPAIIRAGKPVIFFHNHPSGELFPSHTDFGLAGLLSFLVYREDPNLRVEFRVMQLGEERTSVAYGLKGTAIQDVRQAALEYRNAIALKSDVASIELKQSLLDQRLAQESFSNYLRYACPMDLELKDAEVCTTHPQYFIWPSDRFFIHYRPQ
jgi:hypothetical protein